MLFSIFCVNHWLGGQFLIDNCMIIGYLKCSFVIRSNSISIILLTKGRPYGTHCHMIKTTYTLQILIRLFWEFEIIIKLLVIATRQCSLIWMIVVLDYVSLVYTLVHVTMFTNVGIKPKNSVWHVCWIALFTFDSYQTVLLPVEEFRGHLIHLWHLKI